MTEHMDIEQPDPPEFDPNTPKWGLSSDLSDLQIAVVHDPITSMNGGINAVASISRILEAPIYTLRQAKYPDTLDGVDVHPIKSDCPIRHAVITRLGLGRLLEPGRIRGYSNWSPPKDYDVLVTSGTRAKHVIQHAHQSRIQYYHTPPRWLWDLSHERYDGYPTPFRYFSLKLAERLRALDVTASHRCAHNVANSELVAERIRAYYGQQPSVIHPPIDTTSYQRGDEGDYFITINRIVPAKRVDLIIQTFNTLDLPLRVLGESPSGQADYEAHCKSIAADNIEFVGWVDEEQKRRELAGAKALIYAGVEEDFGIPPIEAMAAGVPVIGVDEGFTRYQIRPGQTGLLFGATVDELKSCVLDSLAHDWDRASIMEHSRQFDVRMVRRRWMDLLRRVMDINGESSG